MDCDKCGYRNAPRAQYCLKCGEFFIEKRATDAVAQQQERPYKAYGLGEAREVKEFKPIHASDIDAAQVRKILLAVSVVVLLIGAGLAATGNQIGYIILGVPVSVWGAMRTFRVLRPRRR